MEMATRRWARMQRRILRNYLASFPWQPHTLFLVEEFSIFAVYIHEQIKVSKESLAVTGFSQPHKIDVYVRPLAPNGNFFQEGQLL
jgi:hypothetical protein